MLRVFFFGSLLCFVSCTQETGQVVPSDSLSENYCDYSVERDYDTSDLVQCMTAIIEDLAADGNGPRLHDNSLFHKSILGKNPFWTSLNGVISSFIQNPPSAPPSHHQSNYPGPFDLSPGIGPNLLEAISSISRHDDYKCVPRILCEVASGKFPGRSLGKQSHGVLGGNAFFDWLTGIDLSQSSPLLDFARAMILGYGHKGTASGCYQAYPRCPRDPNRLVYYLNNYNGGFFRLFRKRPGVFRKSPYYRNGLNFLKPWIGYAPAYGFSKELNVQHRSPILSNYGVHKEIILSAGSLHSDKKIIFPESHQDQLFRFPKFSANLEHYAPSYQNAHHPSFFPEDEEDHQEFDRPSASISEPNFTFP